MRGAFLRIGNSLVPVVAFTLLDGSQFVVPGELVTPDNFKSRYKEVDDTKAPGAFVLDPEATPTPAAPATSADPRVDALVSQVSDLDTELAELRARLGETPEPTPAASTSSSAASGTSGSTSGAPSGA